MIYQRPAFAKAMKSLPPKDQELVKQRARKVEEVLGRPHLHSGVSLRQFGPYKEFRIGLKLRCLLVLHEGDIHLSYVGTHDQVASFIRNNG
jgi:hypothetical protein